MLSNPNRTNAAASEAPSPGISTSPTPDRASVRATRIIANAKLPAPYYSESGITIYHADCREVLPGLEAGAVVVTDQPYGTGWVRGGGDVGEFNAKHERPAWDVWDTSWLAFLNSPKRVAAFCPVSRCEEMCDLLPSPCVMHYRKTNVRPGGINREAIVVSPPVNPRVWKKEAYNGDSPFHPCQKPIDVMLWVIESVTDNGDTILDPFMGSGTTLVAAKLCGRRAIGIEINEDYIKIAIRRLAQGVLDFGGRESA